MFPPLNSLPWNQIIAGLPGAHVLQTEEWSQLKAAYGWQPLPQIFGDKQGPAQAAAMILQRSLRLGAITLPLRVLYVPKGPLLDWNDHRVVSHVLDELQAFARSQKAIFIKIDADVVLGTGIPGSAEAQDFAQGEKIETELKQRGWLFSQDQIQFRNTVCIDLTASEDELMARMKQKMRYNIRLAERKGVSIRRGSLQDLDLLYRMYAETSIRDGFVIRNQNYYRRVWSTFCQAGMADIWIAEVDGEPISAVIIFRFAGKGWYLYGMSRQAHREKMPNALLQWEAMRQTKTAGCTQYDLWGAPDRFDEGDPMWGVFRFKEGLGGQVVRTLGAWDYPANPGLYRFYTQSLPRFLELLRSRGRRQTRSQIQAL